MLSAVRLARWLFSLALISMAGTALASEAVSVEDLDVPEASRLELQKMLELHRAIPVELRDADQTAVNRKPAVDGPPVYSASTSGTSENDSAASVDSISESPVEAAKPN